MTYELSAAALLGQLGYCQPTGRDWLAQWKQERNMALPEAYSTFMETAMDCPLLGTSDLWTGKMAHGVCLPGTLYDQVQEEIDDRKGQWADSEPGEALLHELSQRPWEEWPKVLPDFVLIGSDYGSGTGLFGLRVQDLEEADPPVYWHRGGDAYSQWRLEYKTVSGFLLQVLVEALACVDYDTAETALEDLGWRYEEYFDLEKGDWTASKAVLKAQGISFAKLKKYPASNGGKVFCCWDEDANVFYCGAIEDGEISLCAINREEAERIFVDLESLED